MQRKALNRVVVAKEEKHNSLKLRRRGNYGSFCQVEAWGQPHPLGRWIVLEAFSLSIISMSDIGRLGVKTTTY
jgi:hypothetical protein